MEYFYLIGVLMLFIVWLIFFILRKDLKGEIIFAGILTLPLAMTDFFFIPEYWDPPVLFNLIDKIGFSIESVLLSFFVGGLAAVLFEIVSQKKLVKIKTKYKIRILPYIIFIFSYVILEFILPGSSIYNIIVLALLLAAFIAFRRKDLIPQIISSGVLFVLLYCSLFIVFNLLFPHYLPTVYTLENLWGIYVLGLPLEEILFAFSVGVCWSTLYEYVRGYKTKNL